MKLSDWRLALRMAAMIACSLWLAGCVSNEGIGLGVPPPGAQELLQENAAESAAEAAEPVEQRQLILIGTTSSLRRFNERSGNRYYERYAEFAAKLNPDSPPALSREEFLETYAGWTKLKSFTIPLVMGIYRNALVPRAIAESIRFPGVAGVFLVQEAGDLVAAKSSSDGFYVVDALLCRDASEYYRCAHQYDKGVFDAVTGEALNMSLKPEKSGVRIDPVSYKFIESKAKPASSGAQQAQR